MADNTIAPADVFDLKIDAPDFDKDPEIHPKGQEATIEMHTM